jgi:mRNA-degrading endonuclease RelE of RelBE toxin-antitoxin system
VLQPKIAARAMKYIETLDRPTKKRIKNKILELCRDPTDIRLSKPLHGDLRRTARVGSYRLLFVIEGEILLVSDVGPRGEIYKK